MMPEAYKQMLVEADFKAVDNLYLTDGTELYSKKQEDNFTKIIFSR